MKTIITGASKGIGRGIATVLAQNGFHVGLLARSEDLLKDLQTELTNQGGKVSIASCDLRHHESTQNAIDQLVSEMNGVDALINNAGLVIRKDVSNISLDEWHAQIETNINGLFYATRSVLPYLKKQKSGFIINISSISGRVPLPGGSGYAASKYAVTGFSESLFQEVRDDGIKVTVVYPGSVDSQSHRHDPSENTSWKVQPEDVGKACLSILQVSAPTCISQLEIRPIRRPPK